MIRKIIMKNIATYDENGTIIDNLSKINFIYGANGTGKTTISNFLKNNPLSENIIWENEPIEILVYNKKFKEENFYAENLKGIYTLGKTSKENKEKINELQKNLANIEELGKKEKRSKKTLEQDIKKLENDLKEFIWKKLYKGYEKKFKHLYTGKIGSKDRFQDLILNILNENINTNKDIQELEKEYQTLFADDLDKLDEIVLRIDIDKIKNIETNQIFTKKIIGKEDLEISKLINKLNIADWVYQGKNYLKYIENNVCPFCQKTTIDETFRKQLEEYFDDEYKNDIELLNNLKKEYLHSIQNVKIEFENIVVKIKQNKFYTRYIEIDKLESFVKLLNEKFIVNIQKINEKIKEPSRSIILENNFDILNEILLLISNLNKKIKQHNLKVEEKDKNRRKLEKEFFNIVISIYREDINKQLKQINGKKKGLQNIEKKLQDLREKYLAIKDEIRLLNSQLTDIGATVNKINKLLEKFGFTSFKLDIVNEHFYQIIRENGEIAKETLSEGEITFITFLYFLQLIEGSFNKENINNKKILVIDDPISSLDSQILFIVSTLIKEYIYKVRKNNDYFIKQIIILTHNVYFHKEISFISQREQGIRNDTSYYILRKFNNKSFIEYSKKNPIQSSYELLWIDLKNAINNSNVCKTSIQNIMRKILENYFKVFGGIDDEEILSKFEIPEEKYICSSLISWINEGSHTIPDDFEVQLQDNDIEKYMKVFEEIFEKMGHQAHYEMMFKGN